MARRFRCRGCATIFAETDWAPDAPFQCPNCSRLAAPEDQLPRQPRKSPAADAGKRSSRSNGKSRQPQEEAPPRRRRLVLVAGGSIALLATVTLGVFFMVLPSKPGRDTHKRAPVAQNTRPAPNPSPGTPPVPSLPTRYLGKPDPPPAPTKKSDIPQSQRISLVGHNPLFASGDGPYYLDASGPDGGMLSIHDLRTGKSTGSMPPPNRDREQVEARLSPDGQYLMCLGKSGRGPHPTIELWISEGKDPVCRLQTPGPVLWMDFISPQEAVTVCDAGPHDQVQRWKISSGKATHSFPLPRAQGHSTRSGPPAQVRAAISPGRQYLALAGLDPQDPGLLLLMALADGQVVGSLRGGQGLCRGLTFSPDGAELLALYADQPQGQQRGVRLLAWSLKDGKSSANVELTNPNASGPLLVGPDPGTVLVRGRPEEGEVVDRGSGITLYELPFIPVRWLGENRLLGYSSVPSRHTGATKPAYLFREREIRTVAFDLEDYKSKARLAHAAIESRPQARLGDRKAVRTLRPEPGDWAVPADLGKALDVKSAQVRLEVGQALFAGPPGEQAAVLFLQNHAEPRPRQALMWSRYDLRSRRRLEEPHELWPWIKKRIDQGTPQPSSGASSPSEPAPVQGSLQSDGSHLAVRDPASPDRLDVWSAGGERVLGLLPYGPGQEVEWLGWAGEHLLTLGAGKLTAWEVPSGRAIYEVEGRYKGLAALSPGRTWLAVSAADHLDVLNAATGACLGRLVGGDASGGGWAGLAVSRDGRRLAGVRRRSAPNDPLRTVYTWDLQTGLAHDPFPIGPGPVDVVHWCGSDYLLLGRKELVGLELHTPLLRFDTPLTPTAADLDGRLWCVDPDTARAGDSASATGTLVACTVPDRRTTGELPGPRPADWEVVFHAGMTVKLEVELDTDERSEAAAALLADRVRQAGFKVGEGDWRLVLRAAQQDSQTRLTGLGMEVPVPEVRGELRLIAPEGVTVASVPHNLSFTAFKSTYLKAKETGTSFQDLITRYDFGKKNPHTAMAEEVWEHWLKALPGLKWPHAFVKHKGKYESLPLARPLEVDPPGS